MSEAKVRREGDTLVIEGDVSFDTASALGRSLDKALAALPPGGRELTLDCRTVDGGDSSALALLVQAARLAAGRGAVLRVTGLSGTLASLAAIYGLDSLLGEVP